ncbi:MAG: restriction endonuclease [Actinomycetota bacterium]
MTTIWGIHNNSGLDFVAEGFVAIGWEELGDPRPFASDRDRLKAQLARTFPSAKSGAIPVWAGIVHRFVHEISKGDLVISPNKLDRTLSFGVIDGEMHYDEHSETHRNRRPVRWTHIGVPRDDFSQQALNEIGSALTLFRVKRNDAEFLQFVESGHETPTPRPDDEVEGAVALAEDEPNAAKVDSYSRDFVVARLKAMDPYRFEHFTAGLLQAMGYRARATRSSSDGGVDIIASRDPLSIEPPVIKVQCKRTTNVIGAPEVQKLAGALAHGDGELGLFVTLGGYSADATHLERTRQDLRLINGEALVDLIFEHYEALDQEWKRLLPLTRVYAVDREGDDA